MCDIRITQMDNRVPQHETQERFEVRENCPTTNNVGGEKINETENAGIMRGENEWETTGYNRNCPYVPCE